MNSIQCTCYAENSEQVLESIEERQDKLEIEGIEEAKRPQQVEDQLYITAI